MAHPVSSNQPFASREPFLDELPIPQDEADQKEASPTRRKFQRIIWSSEKGKIDDSSLTRYCVSFFGNLCFLERFPFSSPHLCLRELSLSWNSLKEMVDLSGFPNLEAVDLSRNELSRFPKISGLARLRTLNLSHNPFNEGRTFPFTELPRLSHLDLSYCQLTECPDLHQLRGLKQLDVSQNYLNRNPWIMWNEKLKKLDCSHNQILVFEKLESNRELVEIIANDNQLKDLPDLYENPKIKHLNFSRNRMTFADLVFNHDSVPALKMLDLSRNKITDLAESILTLPRKCKIDLSENRISRKERERSKEFLINLWKENPEQGAPLHFGKQHESDPQIDPLTNLFSLWRKAFNEASLARFPLQDRQTLPIFQSELRQDLPFIEPDEKKE